MCLCDEEWLTCSGMSLFSLKEVVCFTIIVKVIMDKYFKMRDGVN